MKCLARDRELPVRESFGNSILAAGDGPQSVRFRRIPTWANQDAGGAEKARSMKMEDFGNR
jgi:hypothetical protein